MKRTIIVLVMAALSSAAQPSATGPVAAAPLLPTKVEGHNSKRWHQRTWVRVIFAAGVGFGSTYAFRRGARDPRQQPIIITPGQTTITWRPCTDPTCGGIFEVRP